MKNRAYPSFLYGFSAPLKLCFALLLMTGLAACDLFFDKGDGDDGGDTDAGPAAHVYVSNNGPDNAGDVDVFDESFNDQGTTYRVGNNEGVAFDAAGNLFQAGDGDQTSIRVFTAAATRSGGAAFDPNRDREIIGSNTGLAAPKGIDVKRGFLFVADFGADDIKVFRASAAGNAAPVATTDPGVAPWDVFYDADSDRLFASLTDGTVAVYDDYLGDSDDDIGSGDARIITPVDKSGHKISTNLHGIFLDGMRDALVVTDVGDADVADDGSIYVIEDASTARGDVVPSSTVRGAKTELGNPVDVFLNGPDVLIAEKAGDRLLVFRGLLSGRSGNLSPDVSTGETKPESIAIDRMAGQRGADVSDLDDPNRTINALLATANPAGIENDAILRLSVSRTEEASWSQFEGITSIESVKLDLNGDAYLTFDDENMTGGVMVISQILRRPSGSAIGSGDRRIAGPNTGLTAPKGLDLASGLGLLFVADFGAGDVKAFSAGASGDVAPVFTISDLGTGERSVWDADYDPQHDRLFASGTDGTVLVYDDVSSAQGAGGPSRTITPADDAGAKISVNLHGIVYADRTNTLVLTDVGDAASPTDGQLFVIPHAASAQGTTSVSYQIGGDQTQLGNPVDVAFDGANAYVAEKSNDAVLRFDNVLDGSGMQNIGAAQTTAVTKAESVALVPDFLDRNH